MRKEFTIVIMVNATLVVAAMIYLALENHTSTPVPLSETIIAAGGMLGIINAAIGLVLALLGSIFGRSEPESTPGWTTTKWIGLAMLSCGAVIFLCSFTYCTFNLISGINRPRNI